MRPNINLFSHQDLDVRGSERHTQPSNLNLLSLIYHAIIDTNILKSFSITNYLFVERQVFYFFKDNQANHIHHLDTWGMGFPVYTHQKPYLSKKAVQPEPIHNITLSTLTWYIFFFRRLKIHDDYTIRSHDHLNILPLIKSVSHTQFEIRSRLDS